MLCPPMTRPWQLPAAQGSGPLSTQEPKVILARLQWPKLFKVCGYGALWRLFPGKEEVALYGLLYL